MHFGMDVEVLVAAKRRAHPVERGQRRGLALGGALRGCRGGGDRKADQQGG